ncbi:MAG: hypothetical protein CFH01_01329 [Alphaproteobacteria bacterium MarineAlpha2_Bin1]|nr:MAG: hypothetical protein CFH01_01329 [Alphaproteobacteria bacterium MarineAlpha2_Bin1]
MNKLFKFIESNSVFIPISTAYFIGIITLQPFGYYIAFFFLSFIPAILGMPDPVGEFIEFVNNERIKKNEQKYKNLIIKIHGDMFLKKVSSFSPVTLRLILDCIINRTNGFNKEENDINVNILIKNKFIYIPKGYTPSGFPFYFNTNIWIIMNSLKYEILEIYNNKSRIPIKFNEEIKFKYTIKTFALSIAIGFLRLLALLLIGISFGGITWIVWVILMVFVVSIIVWSGNYIKIFIGI